MVPTKILDDRGICRWCIRVQEVDAANRRLGEETIRAKHFNRQQELRQRHERMHEAIYGPPRPPRHGNFLSRVSSWLKDRI